MKTLKVNLTNSDFNLIIEALKERAIAKRKSIKNTEDFKKLYQQQALDCENLIKVLEISSCKK